MYRPREQSGARWQTLFMVHGLRCDPLHRDWRHPCSLSTTSGGHCHAVLAAFRGLRSGLDCPDVKKALSKPVILTNPFVPLPEKFPIPLHGASVADRPPRTGRSTGRQSSWSPKFEHAQRTTVGPGRPGRRGGYALLSQSLFREVTPKSGMGGKGERLGTHPSPPCHGIAKPRPFRGLMANWVLRRARQ